MPEIMQHRDRWEQDYKTGRWNYLADSSEFVRYAVISSFLLRAKARFSLLDIGCGEGLLLNHLSRDAVAKYTGLDIAQAALDKIQPKRDGDRFVCSTVEQFEPHEKWDAIVFNEVLYYTADPVSQIQKFERALAPDGIMIVSIYKKPKFWAYNNRCARRVHNYFQKARYIILDAVELSKIHQKVKWQIHAVKPPQAAGKAL